MAVVHEKRGTQHDYHLLRGLQVLDPTNQWMSSRVGLTICRGRGSPYFHNFDCVSTNIPGPFADVSCDFAPGQVIAADRNARPVPRTHPLSSPSSLMAVSPADHPHRLYTKAWRVLHATRTPQKIERAIDAAQY